MRRPSGAHLLLVLLAAVLAAGAAVAVITTASGGGSASGPPRGVGSDVHTMIPADGGVRLSAQVLAPTGARPYPLIVMPTSWGSTLAEYRGLAIQLVRAGYLVVTYEQRGFHDSGGEVDLAGSPTQRDVTTVINWAVAREHADVRRVGLFGTSYGAGVGLLAAAHDARIKAVVATSGWADLRASFDQNETPSTYSLGLLLSELTPARHIGRPSNALQTLYPKLANRRAAASAALAGMSSVRSAATVVEAINRHRPAIMVANGYQDSFFPPLQLADFVNRLTGPKLLQLAPGDHGTQEYAGLTGAPNATIATARKWLDHYVRGVRNGIETQAPIRLQDVTTKAWHQYRRWPSSRIVARLGSPGTPAALRAGAAEPWTRSIAAGVDTAANSPTPAIEAAYRPTRVPLSAVGGQHAYTWTGAPIARATLLAGTPHLALETASSTGAGTLFAYLYDVDPTGVASLISVTPYTFTRAGRISFDLQPTCWTLAAGHRLALVIDTVDPRWQTASTNGSTVTLSSSGAEPATLTLPVGQPG